VPLLTSITFTSNEVEKVELLWREGQEQQNHFGFVLSRGCGYELGVVTVLADSSQRPR
jgi:hypothetical protein